MLNRLVTLDTFSAILTRETTFKTFFLIAFLHVKSRLKTCYQILHERATFLYKSHFILTAICILYVYFHVYVCMYVLDIEEKLNSLF